MECGDHDNGSGGECTTGWRPTRTWPRCWPTRDITTNSSSRNAGHTDRPTISELYPTALQWLWQGYPASGKQPSPAVDAGSSPNQGILRYDETGLIAILFGTTIALVS